MRYSELITLITESQEFWTVSAITKDLPESDQEMEFYREGIEPVDGVSSGTLMAFLKKEFTQYDGTWIVYDSSDGTITVESITRKTINAWHKEMLARDEELKKILGVN